jgi:hypothetical protein
VRLAKCILTRFTAPKLLRFIIFFLQNEDSEDKHRKNFAVMKTTPNDRGRAKKEKTHDAEKTFSFLDPHPHQN